MVDIKYFFLNFNIIKNNWLFKFKIMLMNYIVYKMCRSEMYKNIRIGKLMYIVVRFYIKCELVWYYLIVDCDSLKMFIVYFVYVYVWVCK